MGIETFDIVEVIHHNTDGDDSIMMKGGFEVVHPETMRMIDEVAYGYGSNNFELYQAVRDITLHFIQMYLNEMGTEHAEDTLETDSIDRLCGLAWMMLTNRQFTKW